MRTVTAVMGGVAIVCAALSGCNFSAGVNSTPAVSKDALQKDIADQLTEAGEQPESVTCKEDLVGEVGKTTRCEVVMGPTNSVEPVVVTVTGVDGSTIDYDMTPTVSKDALQRDITDQLAKAGERPESVTCSEDLVGEVGETTRCEVVMGPTNSFEPVVAVTGVDGSTINYEMTPAVSKDQLEKAVSRLVTDAEGAQVDSASCESGLEGKVGAVAYCDVDAGGVKVRHMVEVTSVEGLMLNFDVLPVLTKAEVESSLLDGLESRVGQRPDSAECSGDLEGKPGKTVDCTVVAGPETTSFTLTVTTVEGSTINYSYEPKA